MRAGTTFGRLAAAAMLLWVVMEVGAMAGDATVWTVDPLVKVLRNAKPPAEPAASVTVDAVRNEYESAQFVVSSTSRIGKLEIHVGEMTGPAGSKPKIEAAFVGFVPVKRGTTDTPSDHLAFNAPASAPDPLLDDRSVAVGPAESQPIWLTVYVPKSANPGTYTASVEVIADGASAGKVDVTVNVAPVILPDERTLYLTNWFAPGNIAKAHRLELWGEGFWKMLEAYAHCMAEHRQNVVITPWTNLVVGRDDGSGKLTFDFSIFDRWVELFEKAGALGTIEGGHLGGRGEWTAPDFDASWPVIKNPDGSAKPCPSVKVTSEEYRAFLSQFLPALQSHLQEKGWLERYLQHLCDEPIKENAESYKKLSSYVREYGPKLRIIDACMCSELVGALDVWVPQPPHYESDIEFFRERQKAGDEVWFYTCLSPKGKYMNRFIDYPLIDTRLLHWVNFKYGLTGYLHWGFNYWQGDPFADLEPNWGGENYLPPGDSHIVYPGRRGPLSSIRLEALRDGVEDFELLKMLEKKDPKAAREICDSVVQSLTDYTMDHARFRNARARLVKALE